MKKEIKLTSILLTLTLLITCLATPVTTQAASKKSVKITSIKSNTSVYAGATKFLRVKANTKSTFTYKTSNSKIAKVKKGKVYAYRPGKVKITIKAKPKSKRYKTTSKRIYVKVLPRKPAALGAKRNGKYIAISIKATKGAQGYQYQYATNSKMKNAKTKTTKARSYKFSASASKIYYVRARAYAKSGGKTYYSGWSSIRKVSKPGESDNKDGSPSSGPEKTPAPHKHNFVDAGVVAFDWTDGHKEPGYTGPTSTTEEVDGIYACVKCGCYYGTISGVWDVRYWNHAESECGCGAYSLRTVYAQYHLLECSTPGCYAYRRGKLAYYEYLMYFNGNGQMPTSFILKDWQIKELGLPMP